MGEECYKLLAEINMPSFANQLSEQTDSYLSLIPMNFTELFNNMTLNAYYWITKDTGLLRKAVIMEEFTAARFWACQPKGRMKARRRPWSCKSPMAGTRACPGASPNWATMPSIPI